MSSVKNIHVRFKGFDKEMRDVWETYCLVHHLTGEGHSLVKVGKLKTPTMQMLNGVYKTMSKQDTYGAISHLRNRTQPRTTLLEAVAIFEDYLGWLVTNVLTDFPYLLRSNSPQADKEEQKLLNLIVDSGSRDEIIEQIIEEKVRGIFYGNPVDFFRKQKGKMNFGGYFEAKCAAPLEQYAEVTARRNIIAHNDGRVDRKYMREVKNATYRMNQAVQVPSSYLRESIALLLFLAGRATELILINHYQDSAQGTLSSRMKQCTILPPI